MMHVLFALQLAAAPPSDIAWQARVDSATRVFDAQWREMWQDVQRTRPVSGEYRGDADLRLLAVHCHYAGQMSQRLRRHLIHAPESGQASCPTWYPFGEPALDDERRGIDAGLDVDGRIRVRPLRNRLRLLLDSAAVALPGDAAIAGQRVRFALDADDLAGAVRSAAECTNNATQCALWRGLVLYRAGQITSADSAFMDAERYMDSSTRCAWRNVAMLVDREVRDSLDQLGCTARDAFASRLWWLADPLWSEPGNERRAEHVARLVTLVLRAPAGTDERLHFGSTRGGPNMIETVVRYGWPTQFWWGGPVTDRGHAEWLRTFGADTSAPYVVPEYARGRLHAVPSARALRTPMSAERDDWELSAGDEDWWPVEHFARDAGGIVTLPAGQQAMLRRRAATTFVWAGDLAPRELARPAGDVVSAQLFTTRTPDSIVTAAHARAVVGSPLVMQASLAEGAMLVGIEFGGDSVRPAGRTRFGITVPPSLLATKGTPALSEPLLYAPGAATGNAFSRIDDSTAVRRMLGTTTLVARARVGVYWEAYDLPRGDSTTIELRLSREDRPGMLSRAFSRVGEAVGGALGVWREDATSLGIRFVESALNSPAIRRMEGEVPLEMRSLVLDVSRLARGRYRLQVTMQRASGAPVTNSRVLLLP